MAKTQCPLVFSLLALALIGTLPSSAAQCRNSNTFLGELQLRDDDKEALLTAHNNYRQQTAAGNAYGRSQPAAKNMLELTWDEHAAQQASSWARTCQYEHNKPTDKQGKQLGQNLALRMTNSTAPLDARRTFNQWMKNYMVKGWFDEVKLYTYGTPFSNDTGHYTQMVWATTSKLGCGYSFFKKTDPDGMIWQVGYLVCNYNPAGNWMGMVPYEEGFGNCEPKKFRRSTKYRKLCVEKKQQKKRKK
uniref:SCP domain-containing protein n=1 Tax=Rhodnius neglectus TaxID=72488 RepID=A0A0P4VMB1_9HEMI